MARTALAQLSDRVTEAHASFNEHMAHCSRCGEAHGPQWNTRLCAAGAILWSVSRAAYGQWERDWKLAYG